MSSTISSSVGSLNTGLSSTAAGSSTGSSSSGTSSSGSASGSGSIASTSGLSNYATGSNTGTLSSLGIGSGINATSIINSLIAVDQAPINVLNNDIASYQAQISSYGQLSAGVYAFQTALGGLTQASAFESNSGTSSDASVLSATTTSKAAPGNYGINVTQLAGAQTLVAAGQTSPSASIGSGTSTTLTFQFGTISGGTLSGGKYSGATFAQSSARGAGSVTINSSNNSLQGIAAAINAANIGVTAAVVNDGSNTPYRLTLSSTQTGAASAMKVSASGDPALAALLGNDPGGTQALTQTQAASDANLTVNGLAITSPSNTVKSSLAGVTLTLTGTGSTTLSVAQDTKGITANVQAFVDAYNGLDSTINQLTAAGTSGAAGGPLAGQYNVLQMQSQMRQLLTNPMVGADGKPATLANIGITFQKDGSLALDTTKLNSVLASNPLEAGSLFGQNGMASDSLVGFNAAGSRAVPGSYAVNISHIATQGTLTGNAAAATTITAGSNDSLTVVVDGTAAAVTIPAGTYTADGLATAVQSAINGASALTATGGSVSVSQANGILTFTSGNYGSKSMVSLGGNAANSLIGLSPAATTGTDVQGSIGGIMATGSGQILTGMLGSAVDGLSITVSGGAIGSRGTVSLSQGFANVTNNLATAFNSSSGLITSATNALNSHIKEDNSQITRLNEQLTLLQQQYTAQFSQLDTILTSLNATQSYLTGQLNAISNTTSYIYSNASSTSG